MILCVLPSVLRHCIKFRFCSPLRRPFAYPFTPHAVISFGFSPVARFCPEPRELLLFSSAQKRTHYQGTAREISPRPINELVRCKAIRSLAYREVRTGRRYRASPNEKESDNALGNTVTANKKQRPTGPKLEPSNFTAKYFAAFLRR